MIFAETDRLILRALEEADLPRLVKLLDVWEMVRWLSSMPYPYTIRDAERFYFEVRNHYQTGVPSFFALSSKQDNVLIGGISLHLPRWGGDDDGEQEIGYWLGLDYWGRGLMTEAVLSVMGIGFSRSDVSAITATTSLDNTASQKVLSKSGLQNMGICKRDYDTLRGGDHVLKWKISKAEFERKDKTD